MKQQKKKTRTVLFAVISVFLVILLSVVGYRLYLGTDFSTAKEVKTQFLSMKEILLDPELIDYVEVRRLEVAYAEAYYGSTEEIFSDLKCVKYAPLSEKEIHDIYLKSSTITVYFLEKDPITFCVTKEGKIYWEGEFEVKSERLITWLADFSYN